MIIHPHTTYFLTLIDPAMHRIPTTGQNEYTVFAPMPHCFELFGLDFLVDQNLHVHLLEVCRDSESMSCNGGSARDFGMHDPPRDFYVSVSHRIYLNYFLRLLFHVPPHFLPFVASNQSRLTPVQTSSKQEVDYAAS